MKNNNTRFSFLLCSILIFNGCNSLDNVFGKSSMQCDSKDTILTTEKVLNTKIQKNGNLKIDTNNIVTWDYNNVGKYECKAKITGLYIEGTTNERSLSLYGLSTNEKTGEISGWIRYITYMTTNNALYYVEVKKERSIYSTKRE